MAFDNNNKCLVLQHKEKFVFDLYVGIQWNIERLIWIGFYKNGENSKCLIDELPKDIVKMILKMFMSPVMSVW